MIELYDNMLLSSKAPSNIVFVDKSHYIDCLIKELGIDDSLDNPTCTPTTFTKEELLDNHRSLLDFKITQVSFQTSLYCWVCQMLHETSFQIINMYSIGGQNRASELL